MSIASTWPTKLKPESTPLMEPQQDLVQIGGEDETARSHVLRTPVVIQRKCRRGTECF